MGRFLLGNIILRRLLNRGYRDTRVYRGCRGGGGHKKLNARQFLQIKLYVNDYFEIENRRLGSIGKSNRMGQVLI